MSSASSSGCPRVVSEGRNGNLDQSATLKCGALNAPGSKKVDASSVKEELAVRPRWARPFSVPSSDLPNPVSHLCGYGRPPFELRMLDRQWISAQPVSNEFAAWYKPSIRRPVLSRSLSLEVGPPSAGGTPRSASVGEDDELHINGFEFPRLRELIGQLEPLFDDILVQSCGYPGDGRLCEVNRSSLPSCTPLCNKFVGRDLHVTGLGNFTSPACVRNIRIGKPVVANMLPIGEVLRFQHRTLTHTLGGRNTNTWCSALGVKNCYHVGRNYDAPGCTYNPPLPKYCRVVCIDACKFMWCSFGSVAFHSLAWPRNVKDANGIARTLFINHCNWADVLIVRGRCFSSSKVCFRANRALENLLWNWSKMRRPYVVYREGDDDIGDCDLVPAWLTHECVHKDFCQCHLVSRRRDWHHPGALYSNVVSRRHQMFEEHCGCSHVQWPFPPGCNKNINNSQVAIRLCRIIIHVLGDAPPSVPQRGEPLVFIFRIRELKLKWGRMRFRKLRRRRVRRELVLWR